jgi:predicted metal-dependent phosphoesterase TrpH
MRKVLVISLVAAALGLGLLVPRGSSAPALAEKPVRYEYAELRYYQRAAPGGPPVLMYRWCTADEEIEALGWEGMAAALKAPESKRDGLHTHRIRVFNAIWRDGWEDVPHRNEGNVWAFRRRVP